MENKITLMWSSLWNWRWIVSLCVGLVNRRHFVSWDKMTRLHCCCSLLSLCCSALLLSVAEHSSGLCSTRVCSGPMDDVLDRVCSLHCLGDHHRPDTGVVSSLFIGTRRGFMLNLFVLATVSIQISALTNYPEPDLELYFHLLICEPIALLTWQSRLITVRGATVSPQRDQSEEVGDSHHNRHTRVHQEVLVVSLPWTLPTILCLGLKEFYINCLFLHNSEQNLSPAGKCLLVCLHGLIFLLFTG